MRSSRAAAGRHEEPCDPPPAAGRGVGAGEFRRSPVRTVRVDESFEERASRKPPTFEESAPRSSESKGLHTWGGVKRGARDSHTLPSSAPPRLSLPLPLVAPPSSRRPHHKVGRGSHGGPAPACSRRSSSMSRSRRIAPWRSKGPACRGQGGLRHGGRRAPHARFLEMTTASSPPPPDKDLPRCPCRYDQEAPGGSDARLSYPRSISP